MWLGAGAFTAACLCIFAAVAVDGLTRPDGFDYAQIARELAEGRGFSSRQAIYALHLRFLEEHDLLQAPWPNLHRFPLPSLAMAGWFLLLGVGLSAVLAYGIAFHVATSILLFVWARRAVGLAPAVGAVVIFSTRGAVLETGCTGLAEPAVMFFFSLSLFFIWRALEDGGARWPFWAGVALGLATLARTNAVFAAPLFLLAIPIRLRAEDPRPKRPWRELGLRSGALLLGTIVVITPWLARNWRVTGSPGFSLHSYFLLPSGTLPEAEGDKWDVTLPWVSDFVSPVEYARAHPDRVWEKWTRNAARLLRNYPTLGELRFLPVVALLGLALPAGRNLRPVAWLLLTSFAVNALLVCLTDVYMPRYHFQALPGMLLIGLGVIWQLLGGIRRHRMRVAVLVVLVVAVAESSSMRSVAKGMRAGAARIDRRDMAFVKAHTDEDAVIISDVSWAVTWETGRRTVRAHFDRRDDGAPILSVRRFHEEFLAIDAVYLRFNHQRVRRAHRNMRDDPSFRGLFPKRHRFPNGGVFYYR